MTKTILATIIVVIGIAIAGYFVFRQKPAELSLSVTPTASATPTPSASVSASSAPTAIATPTDKTKLQIQTLVEGTGIGAKMNDKLSVLYTGTLTDGRVFDASSLHGNTPFQFTLGAGAVIKGWDQGLIGMKVGEKRRLFIPSALAYGAQAVPGTIIGANADLFFDVELVNISH